MILCRFFIVYICVAVGDPIMKRGRVGIPLTGLPLPHFCACPKPGPGFPMLYVMLFFMFNDFEGRGDCLLCRYW